jgi:tetratricopeptide (TPR) repeat protein
MKFTPFARRISRPLATTCFAILLLAPDAARAAECPASSPEDPQERRLLAKEWFATAEAAENSGNNAEATRAYACSYKMVAHPFTAYNLGRVSEQSGDNELALKMFKAYITLKPDAQDKEEVKARIKVLEEKIAAAQEVDTPEDASTEKGGEKPAEPAQEALPPPPAPKPAVVERTDSPAKPEEQSRSHALEWIVGGVSGAALVAGIVLNLAARSKMSACSADASNRKYLTANNECNSARPLAYTSYVMFTTAAAGVATDALLLILRRGGAWSGNDSSVGLLLLPSGGGLAARGRF